jgi:2-methylaconitate cis-trans-isomerase PrpF
LFFHERDLPLAWEDRKRVFFAGIDAVNPSQINGLGGATSHTSKAVVIAASDRPDADVNYTFVQIGIGKPVADAAGTCGNLMAAAGAFAVDEGLVAVAPDATEAAVSVYDTNIGKVLKLTVPVEQGQAKVDGDYQMPGVVGGGAKIRLAILRPGGGKTGKTLPLGKACHVKTASGIYEATFADVVNPLVFVDIRQFGLTGNESFDRIAAMTGLIEIWREIRDEAAVLAGMASDAATAREQSPAIPRITMVAPPQDYITTGGKKIGKEDYDISVKMLSMGNLHRTFAASGLYCAAAASLLPGTVANRVSGCRPGTAEQLVRIGHPGGVAEVRVRLTADGQEVESVGMDRTARRIMQGKILVPGY